MWTRFGSTIIALVLTAAASGTALAQNTGPQVAALTDRAHGEAREVSGGLDLTLDTGGAGLGSGKPSATLDDISRRSEAGAVTTELAEDVNVRGVYKIDITTYDISAR